MWQLSTTTSRGVSPFEHFLGSEANNKIESLKCTTKKCYFVLQFLRTRHVAKSEGVRRTENFSPHDKSTYRWKQIELSDCVCACFEGTHGEIKRNKKNSRKFVAFTFSSLWWNLSNWVWLWSKWELILKLNSTTKGWKTKLESVTFVRIKLVFVQVEQRRKKTCQTKGFSLKVLWPNCGK